MVRFQSADYANAAENIAANEMNLADDSSNSQMNTNATPF